MALRRIPKRGPSRCTFLYSGCVSKKSSYAISRDSYTAVNQNAQNWSVHRPYTTTKPSTAPTLKAIKSREPRGVKKSKPIQLSVPKNSKYPFVKQTLASLLLPYPTTSLACCQNCVSKRKREGEIEDFGFEMCLETNVRA